MDPRGRWYVRAKSYYSFGASLHSVLERFHNSNDGGVATTAEAVAALEESWIDAGYGSQEEMMQALAEGKELLTQHLEDHARHAVTAKTLYVEKMLRLDMGEFNLVGRLDRVDEHEDGRLEIIDYKSGRDTVSQDEIECDLAMACYQLLLREAHPGRKVEASIVALRTNARATASLSDEGAEEFRHDLLFLGDEILNRDYEGMTPRSKILCRRCDFVDLCRSHPEYDEFSADPESPATSLF
jgi:RecB family exonuclease